MKKQPFEVSIVKLNGQELETPKEDTFNRKQVVEKGIVYDEESDTTSFRYQHKNGQVKSYVVKGTIPEIIKDKEAKTVAKKAVAKKEPAKKKAAKKKTSKK